jgi:SAM-dependent methyltransferase
MTMAKADEQRRVEAAERQRWSSFYADRLRPCPFFVSEPDECLAEWVRGSCIPLGRALDIGCGNGRNARFLAQAGLDVLGIDLSDEAIAWARERCAGQDRVRLVCGSIFDHIPAPESLDFVYDSGCFHHMAPHQRHDYVRLVSGALKPGGRFGLVCFIPAGGSGLSDKQVYENGSLGGGLGYTEADLQRLWSPHFDVMELRAMREMAPGSVAFGRSFLWVMLGQRLGEKT